MTNNDFFFTIKIRISHFTMLKVVICEERLCDRNNYAASQKHKVSVFKTDLIEITTFLLQFIPL